MKQTIFIILLVFTSSIIYAQTTKVATSTSSTAPVVYTVTGSDAAIKKQTDQLWTVIRLLQQQNKRDSINYVALQLQVNNIDKAYKKALADSMATLLLSAPIIARIDSAATAIKDLRVYVDAEIKKLQDAGKLTDAQVASIKLWMDKNFKF